jgi:hypothetical protein
MNVQSRDMDNIGRERFIFYFLKAFFASTLVYPSRSFDWVRVVHRFILCDVFLFYFVCIHSVSCDQ